MVAQRRIKAAAGGPETKDRSGGEDQAHNDDNREDQETRRVNTLEGITVAGGCGFFNQ